MTEASSKSQAATTPERAHTPGIQKREPATGNPFWDQIRETETRNKNRGLAAQAGFELEHVEAVCAEAGLDFQTALAGMIELRDGDGGGRAKFGDHTTA